MVPTRADGRAAEVRDRRSSPEPGGSGVCCVLWWAGASQTAELVVQRYSVELGPPEEPEWVEGLAGLREGEERVRLEKEQLGRPEAPGADLAAQPEVGGQRIAEVATRAGMSF